MVRCFSETRSSQPYQVESSSDRRWKERAGDGSALRGQRWARTDATLDLRGTTDPQNTNGRPAISTWATLENDRLYWADRVAWIILLLSVTACVVLLVYVVYDSRADHDLTTPFAEATARTTAEIDSAELSDHDLSDLSDLEGMKHPMAGCSGANAAAGARLPGNNDCTTTVAARVDSAPSEGQ
ncbi:hypothetical protein BWP39_21050 [Paraburkholderia acidicola]|uniref:Uncharacterized protein n=1 Tax=Paraburkholderia acidicola TaxID=1912599 RepID=A0A2A4EPD8_9BURK|nr:hypothetical protein [Paraburkholderia acidicola]PCE22164.1 hypothetical protein BWP39_21050 [Paraburkholderia acidicola]